MRFEYPLTGSVRISPSCHFQTDEMSWESDRLSALPDAGDFLKRLLAQAIEMSAFNYFESSLSTLFSRSIFSKVTGQCLNSTL